jgi:outer membrane biosynthesis protein TonB
MRRWVAVLWHASFSCVAAALYFAFVLPRWWELMGSTSHTLGTVLRIVTGVLIGLAALPVVFTLLRTRRPEFRTPLLALRLRTASIALHVLAGVLIIGAAISEIWLSLDDAGQWLFGIYGAAAAIALLGIFTFYLADVAEMPPPPPKPLKPKTPKQRRGRQQKDDEDTTKIEDSAQTEDTDSDEAPDADEQSEAKPDKPAKPAEVTVEAEKPESAAEEPDAPAAEAADKDTETEETNGKTPASETPAKVDPTRRRRRRMRGGVAVED